MTANPTLVAKQGLTDEDVEKIEKLHLKRARLFVKMLEYAGIKDWTALKIRALELEEIEFKLQDAWKFKRDSRLHRFWNAPGCACPRLDNEDRLGTGFAMMSAACPIHGGYVEGAEKVDVLGEYTPPTDPPVPERRNCIPLPIKVEVNFRNQESANHFLRWMEEYGCNSYWSWIEGQDVPEDNTVESFDVVDGFNRINAF